jgi:uncharacterized protein
MVSKIKNFFQNKAFSLNSYVPFIIISLFVGTLAFTLQYRALALSKAEIQFQEPNGELGPKFKMDIASTPAERERGLMYVKSLADKSGMLFIFASEVVQSFWMKNCPLSLDMIFINQANEVVGVIENATPFSTEALKVDKPSIYVVELVAGSAKQYSIDTGDKLIFNSDIPKGVTAFSKKK